MFSGIVFPNARLIPRLTSRVLSCPPVRVPEIILKGPNLVKHDKPTGTNFLSAAELTLADVDRTIRARSDLAQTRMRDLLSAVRRVSKIVNRELEEIRLDPHELRHLLTPGRPGTEHLSRKGLQNLRSDLAAAIAVSALRPLLRTAKATINPAWAACRALVTDKGNRAALYRFSAFCSARGIPPEGVNDDLIAEYAAALQNESLVRHPDKTLKMAVWGWNKACATISGFPGTAVSGFRVGREPKRVSLAAFPKCLRDEIERYLDQCLVSDPFDDDARVKALAPSTVNLRRSQIHTALDVAVGQGIAPESLTSLAELVSPGVVKTIFRGLRTRHNGEANAYASSAATTLVTIAKEWVRASADQITELKRLRSKLPKLEPGLTPKNKQMLLRLDGPALHRLLDLPQKLWRYALSPDCPKKRALPLAQTALMIEFLLHVPLRMANVAELAFEQHISWPAGRNGRAWLLIPGVKTKTGEPYEAELSGELLAMLRTYRDKILSKLSGRRRNEIFVAVDGRRKRAETISDLFKETTLAHLGFTVTPHQMRHIAAKLILDQNPGAFELVKQLLGHKSLKTTIAFYAGLDTSRAVRHHHALIQAVRAERLTGVGGGRRPLRKREGNQ
jgi:integrase